MMAKKNFKAFLLQKILEQFLDGFWSVWEPPGRDCGGFCVLFMDFVTPPTRNSNFHASAASPDSPLNP